MIRVAQIGTSQNSHGNDIFRAVKALKDDLNREYLERPFRCFNPLLDTFPTSYKGVPVNTDFRVGIELFRLFNNVKLSDLEKKERALILFYKDNIPEDVNKERQLLSQALMMVVRAAYPAKQELVDKATYEMEHQQGCGLPIK